MGTVVSTVEIPLGKTVNCSFRCHSMAHPGQPDGPIMPLPVEKANGCSFTSACPRAQRSRLTLHSRKISANRQSEPVFTTLCSYEYSQDRYRAASWFFNHDTYDKYTKKMGMSEPACRSVEGS